MPLINGCKYSCEPCIRGHRATSCNHTDRVLVEVRKPGRPLQSCGHKLDTCFCGRLADAFSLGNISNQIFTQESASPVLATARSLPTKPTTNPKRKDGVSRNARVTKRRTSKMMCPTKSQSGDASLSKARISLKQERSINMPNITWQSLVQQDLMTESPLKPPNSSTTYPNYVYEYSAAPYTPGLPPITPLLVAVGLEPHGDRDNNYSEVVGEHRSPQQQKAKSLPLNYASRV